MNASSLSVTNCINVKRRFWSHCCAALVGFGMFVWNNPTSGITVNEKYLCIGMFRPLKSSVRLLVEIGGQLYPVGWQTCNIKEHYPPISH